jgi:hypothetical protein
MATRKRKSRYKTSAKFRARVKQDKVRFIARMRQKSYHAKTMWYPSRIQDLAVQRAQPLGVSVQTVLTAAIEVGLRHLRTSDIIRSEAAWRAVCGLPPAPRYHGARFDARWNFKKGENRRANTA